MRNLYELHGRRLLVTGANGGIGRAFCRIAASYMTGSILDVNGGVYMN
ncbi:MAG: hypothetical protein ACOYLQ_08195 [Hyphomicrobiaceae bacterium]|jgi:FlaA1/EpsC-like NDP-sugar epimerase